MATDLGRKVAKGTLYGGFHQVLTVAVMLVATPRIIEALGIVGFGINGLLQGSFGLLNLLALAGGESTLYFSSKPGAAPYTRALAAWHALGVLAGVLLLAVAGACLDLGKALGLAPAEALQLNQVLAPAAALWASQFYCTWLWHLCRARLNFGLLFVQQAALAVLAPLSGLFFAAKFSGLPGFLWGSALAWALGALALLWQLRGAFEGKGRARAPWREIAAYARWAVLLSLSLAVMQSADRFFTAAYGAAAVAAYSLASTFYQRGMGAMGLFPTLLVPALTRMSGGKDLSRAQRAYGLSLRFCAICVLAAFLPLAGLGDVFLSAWLPNKPELAAAAYSPLAILCFAGILGSASAVLHSVLLGLGHPKKVGWTGMLGALFGFGMGLWLRPSMGVNAAAMIGFSGYAAIYTLRFIIAERDVFRRPLLPLLAAHAALVAAALAAFWLLRLLAPQLLGLRLPLALLAMAGSGLLILAAGLAADQALAPAGREGVWSALKRIARRGD